MIPKGTLIGQAQSQEEIARHQHINALRRQAAEMPDVFCNQHVRTDLEHNGPDMNIVNSTSCDLAIRCRP